MASLYPNGRFFHVRKDFLAEFHDGVLKVDIPKVKKMKWCKLPATLSAGYLGINLLTANE
ncbi:MAG TPA: hypothetical protein VK603_28545 [Candidatus Saccharimonadales bacterium]|nr:hypothetical protein [Candidatus Saccharimonadales bacterium]